MFDLVLCKIGMFGSVSKMLSTVVADISVVTVLVKLLVLLKRGCLLNWKVSTLLFWGSPVPPDTV